MLALKLVSNGVQVGLRIRLRHVSTDAMVYGADERQQIPDKFSSELRLRVWPGQYDLRPGRIDFALMIKMLSFLPSQSPLNTPLHVFYNRLLVPVGSLALPIHSRTIYQSL